MLPALAVNARAEEGHPQEIDRSASAKIVPAKKGDVDLTLPVLKQNTEVQLITKERAAHLAEQHLALQQITWGKPVNVSDDANYFLFGYETPKVEQRLIGQRTVLVSKRTGLTKIKDRR
ncbi:MAG: hypothetical protein U0136_18375 [Bdellovibrionota bacterium]